MIVITTIFNIPLYLKKIHYVYHLLAQLQDINYFYLIHIVVKLATVVEGDQKAPVSIATTPRFRGGHYSFPWIAPLYPQYVPYIVEC